MERELRKALSRFFFFFGGWFILQGFPATMSVYPAIGITVQVALSLGAVFYLYRFSMIIMIQGVKEMVKNAQAADQLIQDGREVLKETKRVIESDRVWNSVEGGVARGIAIFLLSLFYARRDETR